MTGIDAEVEAALRVMIADDGDRSRHPGVLVGLVGRGIQLSRSPIMHEREARRLDLDCRYILIDFDRLGWPDEYLEAVLSSTGSLGFHGINVTYPFKQAVMPYLDGLSENARAIGAVNTVVHAQARRVGHNTDCWGFAESFRRELPDARLDTVTMFGAGGAGSAVAQALVQLGTRTLKIVDTDEDRAKELANRITATTGVNARAEAELATSVDAADGIVNTTPIGMAKHPGTPFSTELLKPGQWVADIIYFPRETQLLREARIIGCRVLPGVGMAIGQAARAFELFTGRSADMREMANHFEAAA